MEKNKIKLIVGTFIVDCRNDEIDPMTMGMLRMMAVFAQMERDITIQRIRSGMENAKAKGKHIEERRPHRMIYRIRSLDVIRNMPIVG